MAQLRWALCIGVLLAAGSGADAFAGHGFAGVLRAGVRRAAEGAVCAVAEDGAGNRRAVLPTADPLARRRFIAASLVSAAGMQSALAADDVEEKDPEAGGPDEVVVTGEMRLEEVSDKKLQKIGGKARAEVVLRCVGKGIISKTTEEIELADFPVRAPSCFPCVAVCASPTARC